MILVFVFGRLVIPYSLFSGILTFEFWIDRSILSHMCMCQRPFDLHPEREPLGLSVWELFFFLALLLFLRGVNLSRNTTTFVFLSSKRRWNAFDGYYYTLWFIRFLALGVLVFYFLFFICSSPSKIGFLRYESECIRLFGKRVWRGVALVYKNGCLWIVDFNLTLF